MDFAQREAWLRARQTGIGSSDAPNLIGVGYRTAIDVYYEKVGPVDARVPAKGPLRRGIKMEPLVAAEYAEAMGVELSVTEMVRHPERPWQFASHDRVRPDGRRVELKTCANFGDEWGEQGTGDVPRGYWTQLQHQMTVVGVTEMDLFALEVIGYETRLYRVELDAEFAVWLTAVEARFLREHVEPRIPPGRDWEAQFQPDLDRFQKGKAVDLGEDALTLLHYRAAQARARDDADAEVKRVTDEIRLMLGDAEKAVAGPYTVRRTLVKGGEVLYTRPESVRLDIRKKGD